MCSCPKIRPQREISYFPSHCSSCAGQQKHKISLVTIFTQFFVFNWVTWDSNLKFSNLTGVGITTFRTGLKCRSRFLMEVMGHRACSAGRLCIFVSPQCHNVTVVPRQLKPCHQIWLLPPPKLCLPPSASHLLTPPSTVLTSWLPQHWRHTCWGHKALVCVVSVRSSLPSERGYVILGTGGGCGVGWKGQQTVREWFFLIHMLKTILKWKTIGKTWNHQLC